MEDMLKGTKCEFCEHRLTRVMEPFDFDIEDLMAMGLTEEELDTLTLEQHICSFISADIDGRVIHCNKFKDKRLNLLAKKNI